MNKTTIQAFLTLASELYYQGRPAIPDEVYDHLSDAISDSRVGHRDGEVEHPYRMYSLQKFYREIDQDKAPDFPSEVCTLKLDGASLAAYYVGRKLAFVLTRGDGIIGKDITDKFIDGKYLPLELPQRFSPEVVQIVMECVVRKDIPNSRNVAAGALNLKSVEEFHSRNPEFVVHSIQPCITDDYVEDMFIVKVDLDLRTVCDDDLDMKFQTDGMVYRERSNKLFLEMGYTEHHPRGAYALKTRKQEVYTRLLDVVWQVGKSGKVTPVAIFDPIDLDGATVSRASLHNVAFIETLDLDISDYVGVIRSGEIIPYIVGKLQASEKST